MMNLTKRVWSPTGLSSDLEQDFQRDMMFSPKVREWKKGIQRQYGEAPDLNDSEYDYRGAWKAATLPAPYEDGSLHWTSGAQIAPFATDKHFKAPNHPTMWMQTFLDKYGVAPEDASSGQVMQGLEEGIIPMGPALGSSPQMLPSQLIPDRPEGYGDDARSRLAQSLSR